MSQLSFDGFGAEEKKVSPAPVAPKIESWYKGRALSHSSMSMYKTCPQRWKFRYIDKTPEKPKSFFSFGKSVHGGLEFLFEKTSALIPPIEAVLEYYKNTWIREGYETASQERWFFQEGERILRGFYIKHKDDLKKVLQVELNFTVDIEGVPVTGFIDRIDELPNKKLSILDYKTGKAFDKSRVRIDPQLTLYQMAVTQVLGREVESVGLYHLNSLTPLIVPAHSKAQEAQIKTTVVEVAKGITEAKFDPKPDSLGHCQWCDYVQICPAFSGKKKPVGAVSDAGIKESVDRLGKLLDRLDELDKEKMMLTNEISSFVKLNGVQEVLGKFYRARVEVVAPHQEAQLKIELLNKEIL
ncbi:MAG: RecB family exonuclease [Elusimicrobiota bacterium]